MTKSCTLTETADLLRKAQKILIVSHVSPDGDTLGSGLALMHALRSLGKEVTLNVDDMIPSAYAFLPGIQEYRRFAPGETITAALLVIVDASSADRAGNALTVVKAPLVLNIDHHKTNTRFADCLYLDADAAATSFTSSLKRRSESISSSAITMPSRTTRILALLVTLPSVT